MPSEAAAHSTAQFCGQGMHWPDCTEQARFGWHRTFSSHGHVGPPVDVHCAGGSRHRPIVLRAIVANLVNLDILPSNTIIVTNLLRCMFHVDMLNLLYIYKRTCLHQTKPNQQTKNVSES
jgi:hypothetical protein